jgi:hypothetical protein
MSFAETESILDLVAAALQSERTHGLLPLSRLQGYGLIEVLGACKMRYASAVECLSNMPDSAAELAKEAGLLRTMLTYSLMTFVPDQQLARLDQYPVGSDEPRRQEASIMPSSRNLADMGALETIDSFVAFCSLLDPKSPDFWTRVIARINQPAPRPAEGGGAAKPIGVEPPPYH